MCVELFCLFLLLFVSLFVCIFAGFLMKHSTHFIYGFMSSEISKGHSENDRRNPLLQLHGLLFLISSKGSFIYVISHTVYCLLYQLRSIGWDGKQLNGLI